MVRRQKTAVEGGVEGEETQGGEGEEGLQANPSPSAASPRPASPRPAANTKLRITRHLYESNFPPELPEVLVYK